MGIDWRRGACHESRADDAAVSFFPGLEIDLAAVFEEMDFEEHAPEKGGKSLSRIHVK